MPLPPPTSLGLPAKPGALPAAAAEAGPSRSNACAMCASEAKYTCPRCSTRTCSVACSKAHKVKRDCSGQRDPAAYVPLAKYTQGTWDGDYAWLEATRRQVAAWGEGVGADEAATAPGGPGSTRGAAAPSRGNRGRGRGGSTAPQRPQRKSKLDGLRWAVAQIGADIDFLPDGMQRRRQNQSSWNPKYVLAVDYADYRAHTLHLTVQVTPEGKLAEAVRAEGGADGPAQPPLHYRVPVLPPASSPSAPASLLPESLRARSDLVFVLPYVLPRRQQAHAEYGLPRGRRCFFPPLSPDMPLDKALSGVAFIEFPDIHVFIRHEWDMGLRSGAFVVMPHLQSKRKADEDAGGASATADAPPPAKKPKVGPTGLAGLGDYGDSDEDGDDDDVEDVAVKEELRDEDNAVKKEDDDFPDEKIDITLAPELAEALGAALVADFGEAQ